MFQKQTFDAKIYRNFNRETRIDLILNNSNQEPVLKAKEEKKARVKKAENGLNNYLATLQESNNLKMESLLHIYHQSANFVTYANMSSKIDVCLSLDQSNFKSPSDYLDEVI